MGMLDMLIFYDLEATAFRTFVCLFEGRSIISSCHLLLIIANKLEYG